MTAVALRRYGLAAVAATVMFVSGCGEDSTSQNTSSSATPAGQMDAGVAQRLDDAIDKAMDLSLIHI